MISLYERGRDSYATHMQGTGGLPDDTHGLRGIYGASGGEHTVLSATANARVHIRCTLVATNTREDVAPCASDFPRRSARGPPTDTTFCPSAGAGHEKCVWNAYPLHRAQTGEYIGYAQWTSREQWGLQGGKSDAELQAHRQAMRECCEEIEVLYEIDVTDDWLQRAVYGSRA